MRALSLLVFLALFLASIPGHGQDQTAAAATNVLAIKDIDLGYVRNNSRERVLSSGSGNYTRGRWARVEVVFSTAAEYIDQIEFKYYLLMSDRRSMLTGSQTCMYVKKDKWHYTCIYVYPNATERYGGSIIGVAVEVYVGDKRVALEVIGERSQQWWNTMKAIPESMVNWQMTPFDRRGVEKFESLKAP